MTEKVVVAGAGFLGVNTALKLERRGFEVKLIDKNPYHQYIPGLIDIFRGRASEEQLKLDLNRFFSSTDVSFFEEEIEQIDPEENTVKTDESVHEYDYLVLSLGSDPKTHGINISKAEHCYSMKGALKLDKKLEDSESAVIIGSGYVGVEVAGELREKGMEVTLVDSSTTPMAGSNRKASDIALEYMNEKDIRFQGGKRAIEIEENKILFEGADPLEVDTVIWAGGIQTSKKVQEWFDTEKDGIAVNSGLCSKEYENVFAGGDCAEHDYLKTAHNAMAQAEIIAENIDKPLYGDLERFEGGDTLIVSLGDTGVLKRGGKAYRNRLFRYLKDFVRKWYWTRLKKEKLKARI